MNDFDSFELIIFFTHDFLFQTFDMTSNADSRRSSQEDDLMDIYLAPKTAMLPTSRNPEQGPA